VIAHRGASARAVENSLAAFRLARDLGADGVELDVHATRDHAFVVHHDAELPGRGPIAMLTLGEARRHRLGNGEPVPLLEEALGVLADLDAFVEVKAMGASAEGAFFRTLDHAPQPARCAVHSFDHSLIAHLGRQRPDFRYGVLCERTPASPADTLAGVRATDLWQRRDGVTSALMNEVHEAGGRVIAWTVNRDADLLHLMRLGVDGLCTDHPDRAGSLMETDT
jgi:glycerophosphoryl diester phosphodiesterase